jgi:hypothetical protein
MPGIHAFLSYCQGVDGRDKPGMTVKGHYSTKSLRNGAAAASSSPAAAT